MLLLQAAEYLLFAIATLFVIYLTIYSIVLIFSAVSGINKSEQLKNLSLTSNLTHRKYFAPVTIVVYLKDNINNAAETLRALQAQKYALFEIIAVDDGSSDDTVADIIKSFNLQPTGKPVCRRIRSDADVRVFESFDEKIHVTLLSLPDIGRANALNMGMNAAAYPYVLFLDAGCVLTPDAVENFVTPFHVDERTQTCESFCAVANGIHSGSGAANTYHVPKKALVIAQILENGRQTLISKPFKRVSKGKLLFAGASILFKKEMAINAGGFHPDGSGENAELAARIYAYCAENGIECRTAHTPTTVCFRHVGETVREVRAARRARHTDIMDTISILKRRAVKEKDLPVYPFRSYLGYLFFDFLKPYLELVGVVSLLTAFAMGKLNTELLFVFLAAFVLLGTTVAFTAFLTETSRLGIKPPARDILWVLAFAMIENAGLRAFLGIIILSTYRVSRKRESSGK